MKDALRLIRRLRKQGLEMPVLLFSYFNPILKYGVKRMARDLGEAGFDGAIVPDLPPEESGELEGSLRANQLSMVYLIAPTTNASRMRQIANKSHGFIYYVSLRGVTGVRSKLPQDLTKKVRAIKRITQKPVLVGFGVSKPEQIQGIVREADGIVVGSALVNRLVKGQSAKRIQSFVSSLIKAMR